LGRQKADVDFYGVSSSYIDVENAEVARGRFFTKEEEDSWARVAVLGSKVAEDLFGDNDPIGEKLKSREAILLLSE